jgi:F-type H+-transporting ATPase subunit b
MISLNFTMVVQVVNFLVLVWILNRVLFKPIFRIMEERQSHTSTTRARAAELLAEVETRQADYDERIKAAAMAARDEKKRLTSEAGSQAQEVMQRAKAEAREHIAEIKAQAFEEAEKVKGELEGYKDAIADLVFGKIMGRKA